MSAKRVKVDHFVGQYSRQSFDRFGDDLTELIFSFLPFEDKIRLQCVAKQWNRLILNGQTVLIVNKHIDDMNNLKKLSIDRNLDVNRLKNLLKKCPNIRSFDSIYITVKDLLLDVITDLCPRLESIRFRISSVSSEAITRFGQRLGHRIRSIEFIDYYNQKLNLFLAFCPNIESLKCDSLLLKNIKGLKKLKKLSPIYVREDKNQLSDEFFTELAPNLKSLDLKKSHYISDDAIDSVPISPTPRPMPNLELLTIRGFHLDERFLAAITKLVPNLKTFFLYDDRLASDPLINSLSKLRSLTELNLNVDFQYTLLTDSSICDMIENCSQLKKIDFRFGPKIKSKTIDKLIAMANKRSKETIVFRGIASKSEQKDISSTNVPKNLKIDINFFKSYSDSSSSDEITDHSNDSTSGEEN